MFSRLGTSVLRIPQVSGTSLSDFWFSLSESSNKLMKTFLLFSLCVVSRAVQQLLPLPGFLMECLEIQLGCCLRSSPWLPGHPFVCSRYLNMLISLYFCFLVDFSPKIFGYPRFKKIDFQRFGA